MRRVLWSFVALMLSSLTASAQVQAHRDSLLPPKLIVPADTSHVTLQRGIIKPKQVDTVSSLPTKTFSDIKGKRIDTLSTEYKPTKSPGLALLFSALLPGAGQFYNESYWKIPIVLGFGYYFATRWIDNNDSTKRYRELYAASITSESQSGNGNYQRLREFYKDQRHTFSWYIFIYYIVNLVDAYVDASLYDFNVGDDLSIRLIPTMNATPTQRVGLNLRIHF